MKLSIKTWVTTQKGNQFEITLPAKKEICYLCDGTGKHVNPAVDSHGLSSEDFEDPDFAESYFSGHYDVRCEVCNGNKIILVLDWDQLTSKMKSRVERAEREEASHQAERRMEQRMGC